MSIPGQQLTIGGLDFNVLVEGEGPDVLLIHGFPDSSSVWRHQIPALVQGGYRVIVPDLRGFGDSSAPPLRQDYQLEKFADDLVAILDALEVEEKVRVVGHDWGAAVGWNLSIRYPERVDRYVAMAVGHPAAYAHGGIVQKLKGYYIVFFEFPGISEKMVAANDWWLWRRMLKYDAEMETWKTDLSRPGRLTSAINIYRANGGLMIPRDYPPVDVPVMGIWGEGDIALAERQMITSEEHVSGPWRYEKVDGGTHWLQLERPDEVNALLLDYLT